MTDQTVLKTGTSTLGIVCKECIIMAADMRTTAGYMIVSKDSEKIKVVNDRMALTTAGAVAHTQRFVKYLKANIRVKELHTGSFVLAKEAANMLASYVFNGLNQMGSITGFLLGGYDAEVGPQLMEIFGDGSVFPREDHITSGSGSVFATPVLDAGYKKDMTESQGVELAKRAMNAALSRDIASGNGINICVIDKKGVRKVFSEAIKTTL